MCLHGLYVCRWAAALCRSESLMRHGKLHNGHVPAQLLTTVRCLTAQTPAAAGRC